jgi:hypothetical protein
MRKEKETTINGTRFKVTQLGFADGMELLTSLGKIVGSGLSIFTKDTTNEALIGEIIKQLSIADVLNITERLAKSTRIEREPGRWPVLEPEVDLAGNYDLTIKWLSFALEVNYADFLDDEGLLKNAIKLKTLGA